MDDIIEFSELNKRFMDMPVKKNSSGMNARLGISITVHNSAEILLMDEIFAVGDESFRKKCIEKIYTLMNNKKTFLIISHDLENMKKLTNKIIYIN